MKTERTGTKRPVFLLISVLMVVVPTILIWLISSGGGKTIIRRMTVPAADGKSLSYITYIPENAQHGEPAPAFVIWPRKS